MFLSLSVAQFNPGPVNYYNQCRALYQEGVLAGAAAACELSIVTDPNYVPALKLLAKIYLDENRVDEAGSLLDRLDTLAPNDLETKALKARYLLKKGRYREALNVSRYVPGADVLLIRGKALEALGRFNEALAAYREAAMLGSDEARISAALILERMRKPEAALKEIAPLTSPDIGPLRGRLLLSAGRLREAVAVLEETLHALPSTDERYSETLSTLALAYAGLGDFRRARLVLDQLGSQVDLLGDFFKASWLWLFGLALLVGLHLFGESHIEPISTLEVREGYLWGIGRLYSSIITSILFGAVVAVAVGWLRYHNLLAAFTPVQADVIRPIFYLTSAASMGLTSYFMLRPRPEEPTPLQNRESWVEGLWVGVLLALLVVAYAWLRSHLSWLNPMPFNPLLIGGGVALASFALAEPLLREVAPAAFRFRYGSGLAPFFSVLLGGLVWMSPVLLWWAAAALLYSIRQRFASVWPNMTGWLLAALLLLLTGFIPSVRALF